MLNAVCRWLIVRSVEQRRPLPRFVLARAAREPGLARFHEAVARQDAMLRAGAAELKQGLPSGLRARVVERVNNAGAAEMSGPRMAWARPAVLAAAMAVVAVTAAVYLRPVPSASRPMARLHVPKASLPRIEDSLQAEARLIAKDAGNAARYMLGLVPFKPGAPRRS